MPAGIVFITDNRNEKQHMPIVSLGLAYWLWLGSMARACAAAFVNRRGSPKPAT
jgi:hypothetical protein